MSTHYYIADIAAKTFYQLGQDGWYALIGSEDVFQDSEYLELFILEDVYNREYFKTEQEYQELVKYIRYRVVPDLFAAFGNSKPKDLHIFNDCGDDLVVLRAKKYTCIGTRYNEIGSKEHQQDIDHCNKHLNDDPMNERWYNPELYINLPEWKMY